VAPELARVGRLGPLDLMPFCAYCMLYSRWRTAEEAVARIAEGDGETHRLVVRTVVGDQRRNVLAKIAADAAADMVRFGAPFGLSPLSRARLSAGVDHEPPPGGKFDGPSPLRAPRHACPRSPPVRYKRDPLVEARVKCRRAYGRAETDVGLSALTVDRLCAETLTLQAGQRPESQAEMFERTRLLFELLHDRA
jgi:P27 family predicted phage terminase small subunit